jgi:hypothetical protein
VDGNSLVGVVCTAARGDGHRVLGCDSTDGPSRGPDSSKSRPKVVEKFGLNRREDVLCIWEGMRACDRGRRARWVGRSRSWSRRSAMTPGARWNVVRLGTLCQRLHATWQDCFFGLTRP